MKGATSKYLGVSFDKYNNKWTSIIIIKRIAIDLRNDDNEEYAARKRDMFILDYLKDEHIGLNFDWNDNDIIKWKNKLKKSYIISNSNQYTKQYLKQINKYINIIADALEVNDLDKVKIFKNVLNYKIRIRNIY